MICPNHNDEMEIWKGSVFVGIESLFIMIRHEKALVKDVDLFRTFAARFI